MKLDEVPQDHSSTYGGHSKLVYAEVGTGTRAVVAFDTMQDEPKG